jgi:hypothetical protein
MVSEFVFISTAVLGVTPVVITVGERKVYVFCLSVLVLLYMCKLFLQCALLPLQIKCGIN